MFLHKALGVVGLLVFLTHATPLDDPNRLAKRVIATTSCTQDSYYSTVHSSCYSSSFTAWCSSFLQSTVTGAPITTTVTQTVTTAGAAVNVANAPAGMIEKRAWCTSFDVHWPRTAASSACSCLLTQSPPPATVKGATVTQTVTVNVRRITTTSKVVSTPSVSSSSSKAPSTSTSPSKVVSTSPAGSSSSKAPPTTTSPSPTTPNNGNCPATKTNAGTCVWPSPVQNPFFANGLTGWTVDASGSGTVAVTTACPDPNEQDPGQDPSHCLAVSFGPTGGVVKLSQTVAPCVGREYWWGAYQARFAAQDDASASIAVDWLCQTSNVTAAGIAADFGGPGQAFVGGPSALSPDADGNGYLVAMTNPYTVEIVFTSYGATGSPTIYFWDFMPNDAPL